MEGYKGLYISEKLHNEIKAMAAREGMTIKDAVEAILRRELDKHGGNTRGSGAAGSSKTGEPGPGTPDR